MNKGGDRIAITEATENLKILTEARSLIRERNNLSDAFILFLAVTALLAVAASTHIWGATSSIVAEANEVEIAFDGVASETLSFDDASLSATSSAEIGLSGVESGNLKRVSISGITASKDAVIIVHKSGKCLTLTVHKGSLSATVGIVTGMSDASTGGEYSHLILSDDSVKAASDFNVCGKLEGIAIMTFTPRKVSFWEGSESGIQRYFVLPTILSGRIEVASASYTPSKYDLLNVEFDKEAPRRGYILLSDSSRLTAGFSGRAVVLTMGPAVDGKNLIPTFIQYIATNHAWDLLYSALLFILGVTWRLRALILG